MAAGRQGLNGTLTYSDGTAARTYQVRVGTIGYGVDMVYAEDQGRTQRSFYPHRSANQQFSVQVLLKSWDERQDFMTWMTAYAQFALDPNAVRTVFPFMQVSVPVRNFSQQGMPLSGYEGGAHAGMMAFSPVFVFEAAQSPGQNSLAVVTSSVINASSAFASDPAVQYFYPFGTQLEASQVPQDYGQVLPDPSTAPSATVTAAGAAQQTATSLTTLPAGTAPQGAGAAVTSVYPAPGSNQPGISIRTIGG